MSGRNRRGFTLVELLIVIGIIAVLIALLLPALNNARASARTTTCAAQMRQLYYAIVMYHDENKQWIVGHDISNYWGESDYSTPYNNVAADPAGKVNWAYPPVWKLYRRHYTSISLIFCANDPRGFRANADLYSQPTPYLDRWLISSFFMDEYSAPVESKPSPSRSPYQRHALRASHTTPDFNAGNSGQAFKHPLLVEMPIKGVPSGFTRFFHPKGVTYINRDGSGGYYILPRVPQTKYERIQAEIRIAEGR